MATLKSVQQRVFKVEGFKVVVRHRYTGRNARDDMKNITQYHYSRMAKNDYTVSQWKRHRFQVAYPGFMVDVIDATGNVCNGNTKLGNVRDTYLD